MKRLVVVLLVVACSDRRAKPAPAKDAAVVISVDAAVDAPAVEPTVDDDLLAGLDAQVSTGIPACDALARSIAALYRCKTPGARAAWRDWALAKKISKVGARHVSEVHRPNTLARISAQRGRCVTRGAP